MLILFEIMDFAAMKVLLAGMPESLGLLVFGLGLVIVAVLIRRVLKRGHSDVQDEKVTKKA